MFGKRQNFATQPFKIPPWDFVIIIIKTTKFFIIMSVCVCKVRAGDCIKTDINQCYFRNSLFPQFINIRNILHIKILRQIIEFHVKKAQVLSDFICVSARL